MRISIIVTMAAALTTVAGTATAQDAADTDPAPVASRSSLRMVEFTPMTRSERFRNYLTATFGPQFARHVSGACGAGSIKRQSLRMGTGQCGVRRPPRQRIRQAHHSADAGIWRDERAASGRSILQIGRDRHLAPHEVCRRQHLSGQARRWPAHVRVRAHR